MRNAPHPRLRMPISHGEDGAGLPSESVVDHRGDDVRAEQVNFLYRQYPSGGIPEAMGAALLASGTITHAPSMAAWLAALFAVLVVRLLLYVRFRRSAISVSEAKTWADRFTIGTGVTGLVWATGTLLMFAPHDPARLALLFIALLALNFGAVLVLGSHLPAFFAFILPPWITLIIRAVFEGGAYHLFIAAIGAVFVGAMCWFGRTHHRMFTESMRTRYANLDLIRELKEQRDAANRAKEEAVTATRAKGQFLAAASHDLRQPLQALRLFTEALNEKIQYPEVRSIVNNINSSVEALEMLFNELLDVSRLDAGVIKAKISTFPVNTILDQLQNTFAPQAAEKRQKLRVVKSDAVVLSDPTLLVRVLSNLVTNAIRYTPEGGSIMVLCRPRRGGRLRIEVRDNGVGIAPENQKKVFDEFVQLGNHERDRRKGLGLGLAIVKRIEDLIDCKVSLRSLAGRGSVFAITVPVGLAEMQAAPAPDLSKFQANLAGLCVAVIEDEVAVREGLEVLLKQWGADPVAGASAEEVGNAVSLQHKSVHAIVADYRLREQVTGIQAIDRLRAMMKSMVPALVLSGDMAPEVIKEVQDHGFTLLHKPIKPAKLRAAITALVRAPAADLRVS